MRKLSLFISLLCAFAINSYAQNDVKSNAVANQNLSNPTGIKRCASYEALQMQMANDSIFRQQRQVLDAYVDNWVKEHPDYDPKTTTVTIPVVVHIIYKTTAEDISDSRVTDQINATNADWAGLNAHSMGSFATSLKANTNVQFCLAKRDPSGNTSTGITRTSTTVGPFNISGSSASCSGYPERCASSGGCNAWDVTKYLNIWVCDMGSSLCGISEFPGSTSNNNYYGSTINYLYFGTTGSTAPYNLGGTLTHELGHCFNLYHIWGDDGGACTGTDYCNDTPNQADATYGPNTGVVTDACTTTSPGIMYMNFMDYSDDISYANFTPNQVSRIAAIVASTGPNYSLTTSNACSPLTGIEESQSISNINIYPNPTRDIINVNFELGKADDVVISVTNIVGEVVAKVEKQKVSIVNIPMDLSNQSSGIYFVHIQSSNHNYTSKVSLIK